MKRLILIFTAVTAATAMTASAQTLNLWSMNFAGGTNPDAEGESHNVQVSDGLTLVPGSVGGNQWNNLVSPNPGFDGWIPDSPLSIHDADGANPINLTWVEDGNAGDHAVNDSLDAELFQGYYGIGTLDSTMQLTGLNSSSVYDVYVYFTWGWNEDSVDYSITAGSGADLGETLNPDQSTATYADMAEGSNYVVFENISPDGDAIHINGVSSDGGFSAIQLAEVPEPSTYAAILGALFLGFAIWRRRR